MKSLPTNVSESFKARNRHLYPVAGLPAAINQPQPGGALVKDVQAGQSGKRKVARSGRPILGVTLVACLHREQDSDNLQRGFKELRDAIARYFRLDDSDKIIRWEYSQALTRGKVGTMVKIERI